MSITKDFDVKVPPYLIGEQYGNADIEAFLKCVETLCAGSVSPCPENEEISVTNAIARADQIPEKCDAFTERRYFHDLERAIIKLTDWKDNPENRISDSFYYVFNSLDIMGSFRKWADGGSKYYCNRSEGCEEEAKEDLRDAISVIRTPKISEEAHLEAWYRGEDAFYYLMNNALTPQTPEKDWKPLLACGAFLFSDDNIRDNEAKRVGGLKHVKKPADYDGPLTDRELERIVLFEGRFPLSRGSEMGFMLSHVCAHLPYGEGANKFFNDSVTYFNARARAAEQSLEPTN